MGSTTGRTREIWETSDGYVSFGLRGGKARVPSLQLITKLVADDGIVAPVMTEMDWEQYSPTTATDETLRAIEDAVARYFERHTMGRPDQASPGRGRGPVAPVATAPLGVSLTGRNRPNRSEPGVPPTQSG